MKSHRLTRRFHAGLLMALPAILAASDPVFDQARLHECRLEIDPADWAALRADYATNQYYAADLTIDGETVRQIGIRSRGLGSRNGKKPGLKLDINKYVSGQEFHGYKSLVLDNLAQDPSMVREALTYAVFEAAGIPAPQTSFCRVAINGDYWGLYALTEPVSKPFLKTRLGEESGTLYDYTYSEDYRFAYLGDDIAAYVPSPFQPQTNENKLDSGVAEFVRAINLTAESGYAEAMEAFIDVKKFLTYVAVENACAEDDGFVGDKGMNNFYLYQYGDQMKFTMIPWDKDSSFQAPTWPVQRGMETNEFTLRLMADPAMRAYYEAEAKRVSENFVTLAFLGPKLTRFGNLIRSSVVADLNKPFSSADFEGAIATIEEIVARRAADVASQVP